MIDVHTHIGRIWQGRPWLTAGLMLLLLGCDQSGPQSAGPPKVASLSASAELVCAIREAEDAHRVGDLRHRRAAVATRAQEVIAKRGMASFKDEKYRYKNDAYPIRVRVFEGMIEVAHSTHIWRLTPSFADGRVVQVKVAYIPICKE